jgi:hypothetical protein
MNSTRKDLATNAGPGNTADVSFRGGRCTLIVEAAVWGGGSVALQLKTPQGTYVAVQGGSLTANGQVNLELPPGAYSATVTTATGVYATLIGYDI